MVAHARHETLVNNKTHRTSFHNTHTSIRNMTHQHSAPCAKHNNAKRQRQWLRATPSGPSQRPRPAALTSHTLASCASVIRRPPDGACTAMPRGDAGILLPFTVVTRQLPDICVACIRSTVHPNPHSTQTRRNSDSIKSAQVTALQWPWCVCGRGGCASVEELQAAAAGTHCRRERGGHGVETEVRETRVCYGGSARGSSHVRETAA